MSPVKHLVSMKPKLNFSRAPQRVDQERLEWSLQSALSTTLRSRALIIHPYLKFILVRFTDKANLPTAHKPAFLPTPSMLGHLREIRRYLCGLMPVQLRNAREKADNSE